MRGEDERLGGAGAAMRLLEKRPIQGRTGESGKAERAVASLATLKGQCLCPMA